jgi:hypothetical protein
MKMSTWRGAAVATLLGLAPLAMAGLEPAGAASTQAVAAAASWLRVADDGGGVLKLQVAVREFEHPDPARPRIVVAGAVHIAEEEFYTGLHGALDPLDVVFFEGVQPRRGGVAERSALVELRQSQLNILAAMLERYRNEHGSYPQTLAELAEANPSVAHIAAASEDRGSGLVYVAQQEPEPRFELISRGDGEGAEEVRITSDGRQRAAPRRTQGIQQRMAEAMGVVFQLEAMDHTAANWRNSDMSIDDLRERLVEAGVEAEGLFGMLDGSSLLSRFSGLLLGLLGSTEQSRTMLKVMMIDILGSADKLMQQMPGQMGAMLAVLIEDRNEVVLEDLERLFAEEPDVRTVGIIYGAGHLAHMQQRLGEMGYKPAGEHWLTAMRADAEAAGVPPAQLTMMRQMIQRSLEAQTRPQRRRQ